MKNIIKKTLIGVGLVGSLLLPAKAVTLSMTLTNGQFTSFTGLNPGPVTITQFAMTYSNQSVITFYDVGTNQLLYTNNAFTNTSSYLTNVTNSITNYYGVANYFTNIVLIDNTNNIVAATTNTILPRVTLGVTNGTTYADHVNYYFLNGLWLSNSSTGAGTPSITITFQQ